MTQYNYNDFFSQITPGTRYDLSSNVILTKSTDNSTIKFDIDIGSEMSKNIHGGSIIDDHSADVENLIIFRSLLHTDIVHDVTSDRGDILKCNRYLCVNLSIKYLDDILYWLSEKTEDEKDIYSFYIQIVNTIKTNFITFISNENVIKMLKDDDTNYNEKLYNTWMEYFKKLKNSFMQDTRIVLGFVNRDIILDIIAETCILLKDKDARYNRLVKVLFEACNKQLSNVESISDGILKYAEAKYNTGSPTEFVNFLNQMIASKNFAITSLLGIDATSGATGLGVLLETIKYGAFNMNQNFKTIILKTSSQRYDASGTSALVSYLYNDIGKQFKSMKVPEKKIFVFGYILLSNDDFKMFIIKNIKKPKLINDIYNLTPKDTFLKSAEILKELEKVNINYKTLIPRFNDYLDKITINQDNLESKKMDAAIFSSNKSLLKYFNTIIPIKISTDFTTQQSGILEVTDPPSTLYNVYFKDVKIIEYYYRDSDNSSGNKCNDTVLINQWFSSFYRGTSQWQIGSPPYLGCGGTSEIDTYGVEGINKKSSIMNLCNNIKGLSSKEDIDKAHQILSYKTIGDLGQSISFSCYSKLTFYTLSKLTNKFKDVRNVILPIYLSFDLLSSLIGSLFNSVTFLQDISGDGSLKIYTPLSFYSGFGKKSNKLNKMSNEELKRKLHSVGISVTKLNSKGKRLNLTREEMEKKANLFKNLQLRAKKKGIKLMYKSKRRGYVYKSYTRLMNELNKMKYISKFG